MKDMLELMALGQLGILLHYGKGWVTANNQNKKYDLKKAIPMAILSSLTTMICIYLKDDIKEFYSVTRISAILLGYMGNSVFFSLLDTKKADFKKIQKESDTTKP